MTITTYPDKPKLLGIAVALDGYADAWQARDDALLARIAELEKGTGDKPPTVFGASRPDLAPDRGIIPATRTYLNETQMPTTWQADGGLSRAVNYAASAVVLSVKAEIGSWLSRLLDSMAGLDLTVYVCPWHEPLDNWSSNPAGYHARFDAAVPLIVEHEHAVACTILDGATPASWETFKRDDVEVNGVDRYNPGIQKPKAYVPPADVFGPYLDWVAARGDRALIGETGTGLVNGDEAGRIAWLDDAHNVLADAKVEVACLWLGASSMVPTLAGWRGWLLGS